LPKAPVNAPQLKLHISCFLQKCKKAKSKNEIYLSDIQKHNLMVFSQGKDILQIAQHQPALIDVGVISIFETDKIRVLTIRYPHFASFSDMSVKHRISLHGRISDLLK
jgi:hypothetical protein